MLPSQTYKTGAFVRFALPLAQLVILFLLFTVIGFKLLNTEEEQAVILAAGKSSFPVKDTRTLAISGCLSALVAAHSFCGRSQRYEITSEGLTVHRLIRKPLELPFSRYALRPYTELRKRRGMTRAHHYIEITDAQGSWDMGIQLSQADFSKLSAAIETHSRPAGDGPRAVTPNPEQE